MGVPKRKRSRARRDSRHANKFLKPASFAACAQCQAPLLSHQACSTCGFYKGTKVLVTKVERGVKRLEQKSAQQAQQQAAAE
jgi:large subunit ribosomal protein L32